MRASRVVGFILVALGLSANEWLLRWLSPDRTLEPSTKGLIRVFDVAVIVGGLILIRWGSRLTAWLRRALAHATSLSPIAGLAISVIVTLSLVASAEGLCAFLVRDHFSFTEEWTPDAPFTVDDGLLGYKPKPNASVRVVMKHKNRPLYDVVYAFDDHSRRVTPGAPSRGDLLLLFFGDSVTFGEGVNDDETLPFYVSQAAPSVAVYNYGFKGYGPQQMLARLEEGALPQEVEGERAVAIYTFIDDHVSRAIGSMVPYIGWAANAPYYVLEGDRLVRKGSFNTGRGGPTEHAV